MCTAGLKSHRPSVWGLIFLVRHKLCRKMCYERKWPKNERGMVFQKKPKYLVNETT